MESCRPLTVWAAIDTVSIYGWKYLVTPRLTFARAQRRRDEPANPESDC